MFTKRYSRFCMVWMLVLLLTKAGVPTFAQNNDPAVEEFVTPLVMVKDMLKKAQKDKAEKLEKNAYAKKVHYVKFGSLAKVQKQGVLSFTLPGPTKRIVAKASRVEYHDEQNYAWFGTIDDEEIGYVILRNENGMITGSVGIEGQHYEIRHFDGQTHTFTEVNAAAFTTEECASGQGSKPDSSARPEAIDNTPPPNTRSGARQVACVSPTRVLVVSTTAARTADPNIAQTITSSIDQFNYSLTESGASSGARLVLAAHVPITHIGETPRIDNDIAVLALDGTVRNLRARADIRADIVVMLTNGNYSDASGIVRRIDVVNAADAYSIVEVGASTGRNTFSHEMGHISSHS